VATGDGVAAELMDYLFDDGGPAPAHSPTVPGPTAGQLVGQALTESRLAGIGDSDVRVLLAKKLCRILGNLPAGGRDTVTQVACRALEQLARDHVTRVRAALASSIKDVACAPPDVVRRLAKDVERCVAEPILAICAALTDADLLAVIASQPATWALTAIAGRAQVSAPVSTAIVDAGDEDASGVLLDNSGAVIPEPALERLAEDSATQRGLQDKLARRPSLPRRVAARLAVVVDASVLEILRHRPDFDDHTMAEIIATVRRRVDWADEQDPAEPPARRARRLLREGRLDEVAVGDALSWNEVDFVRTALELKSGISSPVVNEILASHDPRAVTALVWRAGMSMRAAMQIQARVANLPPPAMLNARRGTDFPLTAAEMTHRLAQFGAA
jgi:uncharacterized protein (DUF2336 family)